ncbi:FkbM family methyltransferase [Frigoribacterium sp. CG_9.8]|uniref:FkbM family methyltransferase n=1 Tax=Frigoribacterium sp. CG_9.8 TaxID=2787733 RepID=UPI0018CB0082|nr:FkbM family methyltransferase [Frigoribacterium sp. CG_9.8]MBG6106740.1 FkbM family methyltransferase [Frigoribacterium sp. CG_9.8]
MAQSGRFISFAQNGEDVVLNRVLGKLPIGTYVEIGANHPRIDSVSRSFYDRGWSGIAVEPNPYYAALYRAERPRDHTIEAAVTSSTEPNIIFHLIEGTGLSTLVDAVSVDHASQGMTVVDVVVPTIRLDEVIAMNGLGGAEIHFLMIDTEGAELQVLQSIDLTKVRPWILIIEATAPGSPIATHAEWEQLVLGAGYQLCLFDGLSRFYVSAEKMDELAGPLSYPVCVFDDFVTIEQLRLLEDLESANATLDEVRDLLAAANHAITDLHASRSWRVTSVLRKAVDICRGR